MGAPVPQLVAVDWEEQDEFYPARGAWQSWVRCDAKLSMTARCVAFEISDRMSPDNNGAWPSQKLIEARLGCKERTVRNAIAELFDRGWLLARRGGFEGKNGELRKSGFRASYTYIMTVHPPVLAEVLELEQERIAAYREEVRSVPYRQKIAALLMGSKPAESCRVDRQKIAAHTGKNLPLIPAENCRIIYTDNLSTEPVHRTSEERGLSDETVQNRSLGASNDVRAQILARAAKRGVDRSLLDRDGSINGETQARELLIEVFGDGDHQLGLKRVATAGQRVRWLIDEIDTEGAEAMIDGVISTLEFVLRTEREQSQKTKVAS